MNQLGVLRSNSLLEPCQRAGFVPVAVDEQDDLALGHGLYAIQIQIGEFFVHAAL